MDNDIKVRLGKRLGAGAFGEVFKAFDVRSQKAVAVKVIKLNKGDKDHETRVKREINAMSNLKNKHIIPLLGYSRTSTNIKIMMPLREGSLSQLGTLDPNRHKDILATMLYQMLLALDYLAGQGICHRDVKPDNILYQKKNGYFIFQLADLGLINTAADAITFCGTPIFMAPELHDNPRLQTPAVDIWSLFVTVASAMGFIDCGRLRYATRPEITQAILNVAASNLPEFRNMAQVDRSQRASAATMLPQMKKYYPDILTVAQDAAIPPFQAHHDSAPLDSIPLHNKRLDARQQPAIRPTNTAAPTSVLYRPPPPAFGVPESAVSFDPALYDFFGIPLVRPTFGSSDGPEYRKYMELLKAKEAMIKNPVYAMIKDPNSIYPKLRYQNPDAPTQEPPMWRMVPLGPGGRAFGCIPRGDPNGATCHIYCDRTAIPGRTCECHILCNPACPLAIRPRG
ncbi:hypothetical protein V496_10585 [Pseudogymnoascus sp. VKM F-4515 (FW-2607)]|nr:hypothetical protein V496_10585 [Pseudogymnoascus sp. VKM F-4515 (FW-2607)]KFY92108.1 hypothetical protein V498_05147 [Pseudogymnoascus sp. VKM F-4517 (FW-2822)]